MSGRRAAHATAALALVALAGCGRSEVPLPESVRDLAALLPAARRVVETRTLDILLTTPLTSKYILWGKLRGLVSFATPMLVGPFIMLLLFGVYGVARGESPPAVRSGWR